MNREEVRKVIIDKWLENPLRPRHFIAKELKIARSTIDDALDRYNNTSSIKKNQQ